MTPETPLRPPGAGAESALLSVENLGVEIATPQGVIRAVDGISYDVRPGETVALVGESGCGKTVSALAVMGLLAKPGGRVVAGRVGFAGQDLLTLSAEAMRGLRGRAIGMVFQEPMSSLNPVLSIGLQIAEPLTIHLGLDNRAARARAAELLGLVGIPDPERRLDQFPHQLSGGMRQRVMIAIAIACHPKLVIADEPTTALDVTIQAQILELMKDLSRRLSISLIVITHNLGVVARYADRVNIMYAARLVEQGTADDIFLRSRHPYTLGLLRSVPRLDRPKRGRLETIEGLPPNLLAPAAGCRFAPRCDMREPACEAAAPPLVAVGPTQRSACRRSSDVVRLGGSADIRRDRTAAQPAAMPILEVEGLAKDFGVQARGLGVGRRGTIRAVSDVSFSIRPGETLGLVGESGCGKTTVGRLVLRLDRPTAGSVRFEGENLADLDNAAMRRHRRHIQVIFQDPYGSLNPRMTVGQIVGEPVAVHGLASGPKAVAERVAGLMTRVGLYPDMTERYPHELSGGQRQRVGIARALAVEPRLIVCDEPVSALDVSIQAQIINLLDDLQRRLGLTYLFIAHDLAVVRHIATRVAVMYLGRIVEIADRDSLYAEPLHPYTKALLEAAPVPDPVVERNRIGSTLKGEIPSPLAPPSGCVFHTRCPIAGPECRDQVPALLEVRPGRQAACLKLQ